MRSALVKVNIFNQIEPLSIYVKILGHRFVNLNPSWASITPVDYNDSRFLPLALRRLMMRRPALLDILFRKPWVRALFTLLGWYVRFIVKFPFLRCL